MSVFLIRIAIFDADCSGLNWISRILYF